MTLDDELAELGVTGAQPAPLPSPPAAPSAPSAPANLTVVTPDTVHPMAAQWAKWRPRFVAAMGDGYWSIDGVERGVLQGRLQFWPGHSAAVITEIFTYDGGEKAIQAMWAAGEASEIMELAAGIEAYGRVQGCTSALVEGRAGWTKPLKALGYEFWSVTLRKAL